MIIDPIGKDKNMKDIIKNSLQSTQVWYQIFSGDILLHFIGRRNEELNKIAT